jgi:hypothetical protein
MASDEVKSMFINLGILNPEMIGEKKRDFPLGPGSRASPPLKPQAPTVRRKLNYVVMSPQGRRMFGTGPNPTSMKVPKLRIF